MIAMVIALMIGVAPPVADPYANKTGEMTQVELSIRELCKMLTEEGQGEGCWEKEYQPPYPADPKGER